MVILAFLLLGIENIGIQVRCRLGCRHGFRWCLGCRWWLGWWLGWVGDSRTDTSARGLPVMQPASRL
jgi:hypothetical protein